MKKTLLTVLLIAGPALTFAQTGTTVASTTSATTTLPSCVSLALEKRENALISGHDTFNTAIKNALTNRLTNLKAAWAQVDKKVRLEKRQLSYKTFRTESQAAHNNMKLVRTNAWKGFDTDMKACGLKGHGEASQSISSSVTNL